jgi:hypothetical protein
VLLCVRSAEMLCLVVALAFIASVQAQAAAYAQCGKLIEPHCMEYCPIIVSRRYRMDRRYDMCQWVGFSLVFLGLTLMALQN